jgi:hypothetical protein
MGGGGGGYPSCVRMCDHSQQRLIHVRMFKWNLTSNNETIILPIILYEYKTWSVSVKEKQGLKISDVNILTWEEQTDREMEKIMS